jgi:cysteinyl-tRNA synthetase
MSLKVLKEKGFGETLDIHGGGLDLQFPHHENELAQSESHTGQKFAKYWMHNGLLKMGKGKMAGSVGNVINVADALQKVSGEVLRFFIISTHYRSPIDLGDFDPKTQDIAPGLAAAKKSYDAFTRLAERFHRVTGDDFYKLSAPNRADAKRKPGREEFETLRSRFLEHMNDDFNTGGAVGVLHELVTSLNRVADAGKLDTPAHADAGAKAAFVEGVTLVKELGQVLGLFYETPKAAAGSDELVDGLMTLFIELRAEARKSKNFAIADGIRNGLTKLGVTLEDRADGTSWTRK